MKLSQKGLSLVSVLIAAAILGGLTMATLRLFEMQNAGNKTANQNLYINSAAEEMRVYLTKEDSCTRSLKGYDLLKSSNFQLYNRNEKVIFKPGQDIGNKVMIQSMTIPTPESLTSPYRGPLDVNVLFQKSFKSKIQSTKRVLKIIANVVDSKIVDCISYETAAIESSVERSCAYTGGTFTSEGLCEYPKINEGSFKTAVMNISLEKLCLYFGGTVSENNCQLNNLQGNFRTAVQKAACDSLGGSFNGFKCTLPKN